jgi:hypothetical protein
VAFVGSDSFGAGPSGFRAGPVGRPCLRVVLRLVTLSWMSVAKDMAKKYPITLLGYE